MERKLLEMMSLTQLQIKLDFGFDEKWPTNTEWTKGPLYVLFDLWIFSFELI